MTKNNMTLPPVFRNIYKAHIADIDGNLTDENEINTSLENDIIERIRNRLSAGIPIGICSVRSFRPNDMMDNIQKAVLSELPDEAIHRFFLFPEQGTSVISFSRDTTGKVQVHQIDLVSFFNITETFVSEKETNAIFHDLNDEPQLADILTINTHKKYGFDLKIKRFPHFSDAEYANFVTQTTRTINELLAQKYPIYEAFHSRSSVCILIKGINKGLSLRYFAHLFQLNIDDIAATDDQCSSTGVGWPLTCHKAGFSTNKCEASSQWPTSLKQICGHTGKTAWLFLDDQLIYNAPNLRNTE